MSEEELTPGTKVGIAVGGGVLVALIAGVTSYFGGKSAGLNLPRSIEEQGARDAAAKAASAASELRREKAVADAEMYRQQNAQRLEAQRATDLARIAKTDLIRSQLDQERRLAASSHSMQIRWDAERRAAKLEAELNFLG